jgi:hypothetical protein
VPPQVIFGGENSPLGDPDFFYCQAMIFSVLEKIKIKMSVKLDKGFF